MKRWLQRTVSLRRPSSGHRRSYSEDYAGNESLLTDEDAPETRQRAMTSAAASRSSLRSGQPSPSSDAAEGTSPMSPSECDTSNAAPITSENIVAQLFDAIIHDNVDQLFNVLSSSASVNTSRSPMNSTGLDVNSTFGKGARPILHVAASLGAHECLCALVRHGADVDRQDSAGTTAVHLAARNGHRKCIESLVLHFKADIGITDSDGYTVVHWLASNGRTSLLEFIMTLGPSVDFEDHNGMTALHVACHGGHAECASYLLQKGANINKVDHVGRNCLWYSCKHGGMQCCELLLRNGARLVSDKENRDAFHMSLAGRHSKCAARLTTEFPQLLVRLVTEATKTNHKLQVIQETLRIYSRNSATTMKSSVEALSNLTSTFGLQLLCLSSPEESTGEAFIKLIKVTQFILESGSGLTPKAERALQLPLMREVATNALGMVWAALEHWLELVLAELQETQSFRCCYSSTCLGVSPQVVCYSSACRKHHGDRASQASQTAGDKDFVVGASQGFVATRSAGRIVKMIHAYYLIHHNSYDTHGVLDHGIHQFFTRHRRVIRWLILRDMSIVFKQLNFILGHSSLLHLISDVIRDQPFEIRRAWFYEHLGGATAPPDTSWITPVLTVPRTNIFEHSCALFQSDGTKPRSTARESNGHPTAYEHKRPFAVQFEGEPGMGEGVKREWFEILTREILDPNYALFVPSEDMTTYQPNPNSSVNPDHLAYFDFAGRIIGLAIFHRFPLAVHFTRSFYKHMLAKPASYLDAESLDPQYMQSINWILENDIAEAGLELSFSTETQNFGKTERVELLPGGSNIPVTDENKHGYVQLLVAQKLSGAIKMQIKAFTTGLWSFVPRSLLSLFDEYELELLISGIPEIDVDDWEQHCRYSGYKADDDAVTMFWDVLRSFDQPERALVLQFSTGSSRLPIGGFAHLGGEDGSRRFTLSKDENESRLPTASTCFNILRLPQYSSPDILREKLMVAIRDAPEGFAFS